MRSILRDGFVLAALALIAIPLVLYTWPQVRSGPFAAVWAGHIGDPVFLVFVVATLIASRRPTPHPEERRFWALVLLTCGLWLAGNLVPFLLGGHRSGGSLGYLRDPLFFASYVTLVLSADLQPHLPSGWTRDSSKFGFAVTATILCVLGMVLCFFVVPLTRHSGPTLHTSTLLTFVALDVLLVIRFGHLCYAAWGTRWVPVYAWLAFSNAASAAADALTILLEHGRLVAPYGTLLDAVWWLPFLGVVAARRLRARQLGAEAAEPVTAGERPWADVTGQLLLYALAFPATLIALDAAGLNASAEPLTRLMVLAALVAFLALAVRRQRVLERRNRELSSRLGVLVTNEQVMQNQKLEAIGRLAGGVAHDFNNLLTVIMGSADLLASQLSPGGGRGDAERIRSAAERGAELTRQLLAFSRSQAMRTSAMDLNAALREAEPILSRLVGERHTLALETAPGLRRIEAEPSQVFQVLLNLVTNARDAMPAGGRVSIRTFEISLTQADNGVVPPTSGGEFAVLEVRDEGAGIHPEIERRLFEPFSTTKIGGTGLGLAVVYGIVAQGGGHIRFSNSKDRGATFEVLFPFSSRTETEGREVGPAPQPDARRRRTVLLVEDQGHVREAVKNMLQALGYDVLAAADGETALAAVREAAEPPEILLTDVVMPGMHGTEVAERVRALRPDMRVVFMSGFVDQPLGEARAGDPRAAFIAKPFTMQSLGAVLGDVLRAQAPKS